MRFHFRLLWCKLEIKKYLQWFSWENLNGKGTCNFTSLCHLVGRDYMNAKHVLANLKPTLGWFVSRNKTNERWSGATTIRIEMPSHMQNSLIFHYNLKFYNDEADNFEKISLKRFVMQVKSGSIYFILCDVYSAKLHSLKLWRLSSRGNGE